MAYMTATFLLIGLVKAQVSAAGLVVAGTVLLLVQIVLMWPAWIAVPARRFHDMNRSWWWVAIFWGSAVASLWFLWMGLGAQGAPFGMSAQDVLTNPDAYINEIVALNEANPDEKAIKPLGGVAMGGISLAMIFLIIQFGWLHFIPGTAGPNRFGASVNAVASE